MLFPPSCTVIYINLSFTCDGDACTCNVSFYNVQSMELHSYTCIYQKFCILSFIPFYQCILLYMAAHTRSFTIFWSRGWPHNAVRISTFCASSASAFYHTVWITPEARCKQVKRDFVVDVNARYLITHGSDWCSLHLLCDTWVEFTYFRD